MLVILFFVRRNFEKSNEGNAKNKGEPVKSSMTVDVSHLTKHFYDAKRGDFAAVDDISFSCAHGEILGLLGPNGAGKNDDHANDWHHSHA